MLEKIIGGEPFGPDFTEDDVAEIAVDFEIDDRAELAEAITIARDAYEYNRERFDRLPSLPTVRKQTGKNVTALRWLISALESSDDLTTTRLFRVKGADVSQEERDRDPDLSAVLDIEWRLEVLTDQGARECGYSDEERRRGLYSRFVGSDLVEVDGYALLQLLKLLEANARRSLEGLPQERPIETKTKAVEAAVAALASYFEDKLKRPFTQEFDERGQPKSKAALFVQAAIRLFAPEVLASTIRTHMRDEVTLRRARPKAAG